MENRNLPDALCDSITDEAGVQLQIFWRQVLILYLRTAC